MSSYRQHGWRHHPTKGTDPIEGAVFSNHYIAGAKTISSLASGTTPAAVDLDPASISWGTDAGASTASDYFDLQDDGSGTHVITLLKNGLYLIDVWAQLNRATAPTAGSCAEVGVSSNNTSIGGLDTAPWVASLSGAQYRSRPSRRAWLNWPASYGTPPLHHGITVGQNSGASISTVIVNFFVVWVSDTGNTGF